jgi:HSP20 family molecular chaperone IbpA
MTKEIFISGGSQESYTSIDDDNLTNPEEEFELPIDIARRGGYLIIKAPIVGATPSDISLTINNDMMVIHKNAAGDNDKFDNYFVFP